MRRSLCILPAVLCLTLFSYAHHIKKASVDTMAVTTSSAKARDLYERAMSDYENYYLERANIGWRAATKEDPDFALAYAFLAFNSRDPVEVSASLAKAESLQQKVRPGERLLLKWIVNVCQNRFIDGISAMNDMLSMFPKDKRLLYLAGNWMIGESGYDRAEVLFERALAIDPKYPASLNDLAYCFARQRRFDQALATMDRYVAVLPGEPNPQDSYAELLRMSGKFEAALDHYRAALKIDPEFVSSQVGLGDTYALMGNQEQARVEYDKAIQQAQNDADRLDYSLQRAISYVRESNFAQADKACQAVADRGHTLNLHFEEAKAYRMMGTYEHQNAAALEHLQLAENALDHDIHLTQTEREEERARILRQRVAREIDLKDELQAHKALQQLQAMADSSRSRNIQNAWHGASGAMLLEQGKFQGAISHLEEDVDNPCSLAPLARAYAAMQAADKVRETEGRLRTTYVPTLEQALELTSAGAQAIAGN